MLIKNSCLLLLLLLCIFTSTLFSDEIKTVQTPIGDIELIKIQRGAVQVGRDISLMERALRTGEPKRLNEEPKRRIEVSEDYFYMRRKITILQYSNFLNAVDSDKSKLITRCSKEHMEERDGIFAPRPKDANGYASFITYSGANALAKFLTDSTAWNFELPTEAHFMLASVGPDAAKSYDYVFAKELDQNQFPVTRWPSGFEGFVSSIGEYMVDDDSKSSEHLLKRCLNSLYSREYVNDKSDDGSCIFGVRLLARPKESIER